MAFKKPSAPSAVPDSPDRLFRDLPRRKLASLFDHQGQMLRTYVAKALSVSDVALQLPTGSGKTLVGLLLAEWRRRKFGERVLYLCPTRQLVNQVAEEASSKYGLTIEPFTGKIKSYTPAARTAYENADRVAVATYSSLFNVNPFFSNPEIVIVDDAHASENYIASHWTLQISRLDEEDATLFKAVSGVLKGVLSKTSYSRLTSDAKSIEDITWVDKVPTPQLAEISAELRAAIAANIGDSDKKYPWRMIRDHLNACQLYVSSTEVLIRPLIPPTWAHAPFAGATQRIYMSATLGAGGDLERLTGRSRITRLPIPEGWDRQGIGRRFFIFPEKSLKENEVGALRRKLMKEAGRSLVLTPSDKTAKATTGEVEKSLKYPVFSGADLEDRKKEFVKTSPAVAIVANRYDGIDLPDDDCRLLFIEGLPRAVNLQERFLMVRMGANLLYNERVQTRVLQAVGRCTRGLNDYSAVVVTGEDLPAYFD
jgi:Rad3-related DNA helicase